MNSAPSAKTPAQLRYIRRLIDCRNTQESFLRQEELVLDIAKDDPARVEEAKAMEAKVAARKAEIDKVKAQIVEARKA